jgi:hypothetical protein
MLAKYDLNFQILKNSKAAFSEIYFYSFKHNFLGRFYGTNLKKNSFRIFISWLKWISNTNNIFELEATKEL